MGPQHGSTSNRGTQLPSRSEISNLFPNELLAPAGCEALSFFFQRTTLERSLEGRKGMEIQEILGTWVALVFLARISDHIPWEAQLVIKSEVALG
jgi:hypothetical protein